jgi:hypothetical protein
MKAYQSAAPPRDKAKCQDEKGAEGRQKPLREKFSMDQLHIAKRRSTPIKFLRTSVYCLRFHIENRGIFCCARKLPLCLSDLQGQDGPGKTSTPIENSLNSMFLQSCQLHRPSPPQYVSTSPPSRHSAPSKTPHPQRSPSLVQSNPPSPHS